MCWYKNAGVAGYAEAFRPVQSDSQTSEWYSYFENDVLVTVHTPLFREVFWHEYDNLPDCNIPFATLIAFARSVSRPVNGMITLEFYNILWQL